MSEKVMVYSEAFKMQVVDDLDRGRFGSPHEAARAYGIGGAATVPRWVRQCGKWQLLKKVVKVSKQGEPGEIKRLKDRVRRLEVSLADAHMDSALDRAFFEMLCERTKTDPAAFKKKHDAAVLGKRGSRLVGSGT